MRHAILFLIGIVSAFSLKAQEVRKVSLGDNTSFGITYNLPLTGYRITVTARCTETTAGIYAPYASKLLGLDDVPMKNETHWEFVSATCQPAAIADTAQLFHIDFPEKGVLPTFYLADDRRLWAINQTPEPVNEPTVDTSTTTDTKGKKVSATSLLTPAILKAGSKARQADLCVQEIFHIRESRSELIRGEADNMPSDGQQLQLMLDGLQQQEEAWLSLFTGTQRTYTTTRTFSFFPTAPVEKEVLFRLSSQLGFVSPDDLAGAPYYVSLTMTEDNRAEEFVYIDPKRHKTPDMGIAHCVPGRGLMRLFTPRETILKEEGEWAQFGHVERLPSTQFTDKKRPASALFNLYTGSLILFQQTNP